MILEMEQWHLGYAQILRDCRGGGNNNNDDDFLPQKGRVLILCNLDADAMCAARILSYLLRADGIPYQLRPCASHDKLTDILTKMTLEENEGEVGGVNFIKAVVLLNLGAGRNLTRLFRHEKDAQKEGGEEVVTMLPPETKCYVLDSHRPFHLANVHAGRNVVLFWDKQWEEDLPSDGDDLSGRDSSSSEEESDDDDEDEDTESESEDEDEGETEFDADPTPQKPDLEEENDEYDGDDDGDGDKHEPRRKRRKRSESKDDLDDDDDVLSDNEDKNGTNNDKDDETPQNETSQDDSPEESSSPSAAPQSIREIHKQRRERIRIYYSAGSYFGSPASWMTYTLSNQLRFGDVGDLLWLSCVGVTDSYVHGRLDVAGYTEFAFDLRRHTMRLYPNDVLERVGKAVYAEENLGVIVGDDILNEGEEEERRENENVLGEGGRSSALSPTPRSRRETPKTQVGLSENGRILCENEFRFLLLRHTSLMESMMLSPYLSARMQLWRNQGMQRLKEMLAKMGYPLEQCVQPYAFMKPKLKRRLKEMVSNHAEEYKLENVSYTGFVRVTGFKSLLSASDMSYAITALLECDTPATLNNDTATSDEDKAQQEDLELLQSFNVAYDALNSNGVASTLTLNGVGVGSGEAVEGQGLSNLVNGGNMSGSTGLGAGIRLAMSLQRSIIATAVNLVDRNAITRLNHFRYAYLHCTSQGSSSSDFSAPTNMESAETQKHHIFAKPLALTKLAHFLMDMHRENGKWVGLKSRPLVLLAEKPRTGTYLVVGYEYAEKAGNVLRNRFGQNFELAAKTMKGTFRFDSFDTNVIEVNGKDVQRFIEQLHYMMETV